MQCNIDIQGLQLGEQWQHINAYCFAPPKHIPAKSALFCLAGGGSNSLYFNLDISSDKSYSFAQTMAEKGHWVFLIDPPGVGNSSCPSDGYTLTLERILLTYDFAVRHLHSQYCASIPRVGVGHSMGALLTLFAQHHYQTFDAIALLGFGHQGMADFIKPEVKSQLHSGIDVIDNCAQLAKLQFNRDYVDIVLPKTSSDTAIYADAMEKTKSKLITTAAIVALTPGVALGVASTTIVPTFLCNGDQDICEATQEVAISFSSAASVTSETLIDCGHLHFISDARHRLLDSLEQWLIDTTN